MNAPSAINAIENALWLATAFAQVALLFAIVLRGMAMQFKAFCLYLAASVLQTVALRSLGGEIQTLGYRILWMDTEPAFLVLQLLVVVEFFRLLYRAYPGIQAFARALLLGAATVAVIVTFGTVQLDVHRILWTMPNVQRLFVVKRVVSALLGFLLLTTMSFFPAASSASDVRLHGWLLSTFFTAIALSYFCINFGLAIPCMGTALLGVELSCFVVWLIYLRPVAVRASRPSTESLARTERWNKDLILLAKWLVR